jgi:hypothetical protein
MRWHKSHILITLILFFAVVPTALAQSWADREQGVMVGRISDVEGGQLLRYVPEEKDWVATVKDTPFGLDDALYSEQDARAEVIMPNGARMRIGGDTQVQLIALREDVTEVDVAAGTARFYNNGDRGVVKVTTPFGYVVAGAGATFDVSVGAQSAEVMALAGKVDFIREHDRTRYSTTAGSSSIVADSHQVTEGDAQQDAAWDNWNLNRDEIWARRVEVKGDSVKYLPEDLRDEAYDLETNGRWEKVNYEGEEHYLWRPTHVSADWEPYTEGRWTDYHEDNTWVPDEPFGYVTHHYGNWVWVDTSDAWYWVPPTVSIGVGVNFALGCPFCWHPGRVGWIYSDVAIGWFPLAPFEPFYCHHWWGPGSIIVADININRFHVDIDRFRFVNHAVVINQHNLYRVNNYRNFRLANINRNSIARDFRAAPLVNNRIVRNAADLRNRHAFTNVTAARKPSATVLKRIERNQQIARQAARVTPKSIEHSVAAARPRRLARGTEETRSRSANGGFATDKVRNSRVNPEGSKALAGKRAAAGIQANKHTVRGQRALVSRAPKPTKPGSEMRTAKPALTRPPTVSSRGSKAPNKAVKTGRLGRTPKVASKVGEQPKRVARGKRSEPARVARSQRHAPSSFTESRWMTRSRQPNSSGASKLQRHGPASLSEPRRITRGRQPESFGPSRRQRQGPSALSRPGRMTRGRKPESFGSTKPQRQTPSSLSEPRRITRGRQPESFGPSRRQRQGPSALSQPGRMTRGRKPESFGSTKPQLHGSAPAPEAKQAARGR